MKKYFEIYKDIKNKILTGEYVAGEKLPSKRVTADRYGFSVITVETAYGMLADEGYIVSKERSGYFVCKIDAPSAENKTEPIAFDYLDENDLNWSLDTIDIIIDEILMVAKKVY